MDENSIWYQWDHNSPGWIKRKLAKGEYVGRADMARIGRLHPGCLSDPVILEHNFRLHEGRVAKDRGRPESSFGRQVMICFAGMLVKEQVAEWRQGVGDDVPKKGRSEKSRTEAAFEKFGWPLALSGRALANAVSAQKRHPLFGE